MFCFNNWGICKPKHPKGAWCLRRQVSSAFWKAASSCYLNAHRLCMPRDPCSLESPKAAAKGTPQQAVAIWGRSICRLGCTVSGRSRVPWQIQRQCRMLSYSEGQKQHRISLSLPTDSRSVSRGALEDRHKIPVSPSSRAQLASPCQLCILLQMARNAASRNTRTLADGTES